MPQFRDNLPEGARTFNARLQVQWADVDIAGIMYFAQYARFAEYAEMEMFRELGLPYNTIFDELDFWLPRVHVEAEYHAPALMGDWMRMRTNIERVGASSIRWVTVLFNETKGVVSAKMTFTVACMNRQTKKGMPLPPVVREKFIDQGLQ